jgi:hypothetical protein
MSSKSRLLLLLLFGSLLLCGWTTGGVLGVPEGYTRGVPWVGTRPNTERTSDLMSREKQQAGKAGTPKIKTHPIGKLDFQNLAPNPDSPRVSVWPPTNSGPVVAQSPQAIGVNFLGATLADTRSFPPDSMGAVGPSQFIVAVNGRIRSFNKFTGSTDGVLDVDTDIFFASAMTSSSGNFTSDPRIRYDRLSGRWFIIMIDVPGGGSQPNRIMIAVSDSATVNANTVWRFYYFQHDQVAPTGDTGKFADYPTLGIDANALYIGVNIFGSRGLRVSFSNTTGFVVRKSSLLGGGPIVVTAFRSLIGKHTPGPYTPQGVDNYDPAASEGYFIGVDSGFYGRLQLLRVSNPGGTPSISPSIAITIPLNGATITVPHLGNTGGSSGNLDGLDYRLLAAHIRNGRLWTSENVAVDNTGVASGSDTRMAVRWYELAGIPSGQTPNVSQSGTLYQPSASNTSDQRSYWMGTVMVSGQGHAAMGFSVAGANERINAGTVGRLVGDSLGTMRTPVLYTSSSTSYNPASDAGGSSGRRWGDYSYTSLDPSDDMTMWTIQEFCNATDSYGVQVVRLLAPGPAVPASCSPASLNAGVSGGNVVVTGTGNGDTGFFDPGPGFSNRIAAAVSGGGVTVNSVTYTDPTHVTLNLSVSGAAVSGTRSVTISNPDGQSASSSTGILTIIGASNAPPTLAFVADRTMDELTTLTFTNSATDPNGDPLTFSLDPGAPEGAALDPATGVFTWTPNETQGPSTNPITIRVADNRTPPLSSTQSFVITVNEVNQAPVLNPINDRTIHQGFTLTFTNTVSDADIPANILSFALTNAPAGASVVSASGVFTWAPDESFINTTNPVTVQVTDNGIPPLKDSRGFVVTVLPRPRLQPIVRSNAVIQLSWTSIAGQTYRVQFTTGLSGASWTDLAPDITANGPLATQTDNGATGLERFYRVLVLR